MQTNSFWLLRNAGPFSLPLSLSSIVGDDEDEVIRKKDHWQWGASLLSGACHAMGRNKDDIGQNKDDEWARRKNKTAETLLQHRTTHIKHQYAHPSTPISMHIAYPVQNIAFCKVTDSNSPNFAFLARTTFAIKWRCFATLNQSCCRGRRFDHLIR